MTGCYWRRRLRRQVIGIEHRHPETGLPAMFPESGNKAARGNKRPTDFDYLCALTLGTLINLPCVEECEGVDRLHEVLGDDFVGALSWRPDD